MATQDQAILESILYALRNTNELDVEKGIQLESENVSPQWKELVAMINLKLQHLQSLETYLPEVKQEIPQLLEGINEVLKTIEKAAIRVLDNTDGLLEHHDSIEQTLQTIRENPVFDHILGNRLDKINHAQSKVRMFTFDIIQAQEFQELTKKKTNQLLSSLGELENSLAEFKTIFSSKVLEDSEAPKEEEEAPEPASQDIVDQLLAEFGL